jgi:hypothetical protein
MVSEEGGAVSMEGGIGQDTTPQALFPVIALTKTSGCSSRMLLFRHRRMAIEQGDGKSERYVDSPSDKRASTSASLQVRSFLDRPAEPVSVILTLLRFCMVSRMFCFRGDVTSDIGASSCMV